MVARLCANIGLRFFFNFLRRSNNVTPLRGHIQVYNVRSSMSPSMNKLHHPCSCLLIVHIPSPKHIRVMELTQLKSINYFASLYTWFHESVCSQGKPTVLILPTRSLFPVSKMANLSCACTRTILGLSVVEIGRPGFSLHLARRPPPPHV